MKRLVLALLFSLIPAAASAQWFTDAISPAEFAQRRARVLEQIGDGVVIMQGAVETPTYSKFRQSAQFFYLTGVEVPRALLVMDGRTKKSTLYLPPNSMERSEGPMLSPGADAARMSGLDRVAPRAEFDSSMAALAGRVVYTTFRGESLGAGTPDRVAYAARGTRSDVLDQRPSREEWFRSRLLEKVPTVQFRNVDSIVDAMRMIKSAREIELIRESTRIAGEAMLEAMRSAEPGMYEYEIEAIGDYIFKKNNAQGPAYFSLAATGQNAAWPHYHRAQSRLEAGQLMLFDYAPDYKYYTSDVTRMFPVSGKFTPEQRELYDVYAKLYTALMTSIRPNVTPREVIVDAVKKMDAIMASYTFGTAKNKEAATRFVDGYRRTATGTSRASLGHMVGMEVHDVTTAYDVLKPGMVFTIEPAITIDNERVYVRLEDMILITPTGYENLSRFVPYDVASIERIMAEPGMARKAVM